MDENSKSDIAQYRRLSAIIDLSDMSFNQVMQLIRGFLLEKLPELPGKCNLTIDATTLSRIKECLEFSRRFSIGNLTADKLAESRVAMWNIHNDQEQNSDARRLARVAVSALYDEESAEYSTYGSEAMFEVFFSALADLNQDCCSLFVDYATNEIVGGKLKH